MNEKYSSDYIYCSKCGKKNSIEDNFCTNCGNKLKSMEDTFRDKANEVKENIKNSQTYREFTDRTYDESINVDFDNKEMVNFIQKNVEYYIPKFKDIKELRQSTSWNWAAFFFNTWWFLYRKMYGIGFTILIASFILTSIAPVVTTMLNIGIAILSGLFGNILYFRHVQTQISSVNSLDENIRQRILLSRGGVNLIIPIILLIIVVGCILLLGLLGTFIYMITSSYYY